MLTEEQKKLLNEIREKFKPDEIVADLCILYEITSYKDESAEADFWDMYMDFYELGDDQNFIREKRKNEKLTMYKKKRDQNLNQIQVGIETSFSSRSG